MTTATLVALALLAIMAGFVVFPAIPLLNTYFLYRSVVIAVTKNGDLAHRTHPAPDEK